MTTFILRECEDDGYLYIVDVEIDLCNPERIFTWWPLGLKAAAFKRDYGEGKIGQTMHSGGLTAVYIDQDGLTYRLVHDGLTTPTYVERQTIPRPSTKAETRWYRGRWQKFLKSAGRTPKMDDANKNWLLKTHLQTFVPLAMAEFATGQRQLTSPRQTWPWSLPNTATRCYIACPGNQAGPSARWSRCWPTWPFALAESRSWPTL